MVIQVWRERLAYVAMSAFVVWHASAMVIATAPNNENTAAARRLFQPYLALLRLDNNWGFFAPDVPRGYQFRYVVEDAAGKSHGFSPDEQLNRLSPSSIWFRDRYKALILAPDVYGEAIGLELCREHAALRPVSITLVEIEQNDFLPKDRLSGKSPLDSDFVDTFIMKVVECPKP